PIEPQMEYFLGVTGYFAFQFYYNDFNFEHELLFLLVLSILSLPFFSFKQNIFFSLSLNMLVWSLLIISPTPLLNAFIMGIIFSYASLLLFINSNYKYRFRQQVVDIVNFLKNVFEATSEAIVILDKDGNIIDANALFRKL